MTLTVTMLLADHAQVAGGKLYINGGGWSVVDAPYAAFPYRAAPAGPVG